jgi:lipopolysaccharide transport system permease protein
MRSSETLIITPHSIEKNYWKDLWRYRELFYILAWRDLKVRYKQTVLGVAWSILRPLLTTIIFYIVFNKIAKLPTSGSAPYILMVFVGMVPWQFFSNGLSEASNSLIGNANLISKVYFPRMIVPASAIITALIDLLISLVLLIILFIHYSYVPDAKILFLPLFILFAFIVTCGASLLITALNVKYRDFRYIIPFIIQFGLYITPIGFSSTLIPEKYRFWYALNPMVSVIEGFRWCMLDQVMYWPGLALSLVIAALLLIVGIQYFRSTERGFADII